MNDIFRPIDPLDGSYRILVTAIRQFKPTYIMSMISGGRDSAASHQVLLDFGIKIDGIIHGNTRCGIPETTRFVEQMYNPIIADAGTAYEEYVIRKGFFGKGLGAHGFSYRILKATPFRKVISKHFRNRKRDVVILLINGARKDESENRQKHLNWFRRDPASPNNIWISPIFDWSENDRDIYLSNRQVKINPVAIQLCRSGECMCGTMQSKAERLEAAAIYPNWGNWLADLEREAIRLHGFGWGEPFPKQPKTVKNGFYPMCKDCLK